MTSERTVMVSPGQALDTADVPGWGLVEWLYAEGRPRGHRRPLMFRRIQEAFPDDDVRGLLRDLVRHRFVRRLSGDHYCLTNRSRAILDEDEIELLEDG